MLRSKKKDINDDMIRMGETDWQTYGVQRQIINLGRSIKLWVVTLPS